MDSPEVTLDPHAQELTSSDSNLSITTIRGRSWHRESVSISLKSPRPDGSFFVEPGDVDQDAINLESARRAFAEGINDPDELKEALGAVLAITDKLHESISVLRASYKKLQATNIQLQQTQTELETSLVLEKSNLALERANNEMLEEALRREGTSGKDLGWKRWSDREGLKRTQTPDLRRNQSQAGVNVQGSPALTDEEPTGRRRSTSIGSSGGGTASAVGSPTIATPPAPSESSRFFKFRFGGGTTRDSVAKVNAPPTPPNRSPVIPSSAAASGNTPAHLTSSSLPSLVNGPPVAVPATAPTGAPSQPPSPRSKAEINNLAMELELLKAQHNALQRAHSDLQSTHTSLSGNHRALSEEKRSLEDELESLSQALFEEANKMVADERKRAAAFEEELDSCRAEKDALKGALRVVEEENGRFRQKAEAAASHDTASLHAVKSQPSSPVRQSQSSSPARQSPTTSIIRSPVASPTASIIRGPVASIPVPEEDDLDSQLPPAEDLMPIVNLTSRPASRNSGRPSSRTGSMSSRPGTPSRQKRPDYRTPYI